MDREQTTLSQLVSASVLSHSRCMPSFMELKFFSRRPLALPSNMPLLTPTSPYLHSKLELVWTSRETQSAGTSSGENCENFYVYPSVGRNNWDFTRFWAIRNLKKRSRQLFFTSLVSAFAFIRWTGSVYRFLTRSSSAFTLPFIEPLPSWETVVRVQA